MGIRLTPRERLALRLREAGYDCVAKDIHGAVGGYRRWQYLDDTTVTWEADIPLLGESRNCCVGFFSYDTMTDCARGIKIGTDSSLWPRQEVYALRRTTQLRYEQKKKEQAEKRRVRAGAEQCQSELRLQLALRAQG